MYIAQFFALEVFFRGFMLSPLRRSFGSGAVFAMCVPYVMIHYGKPYLESAGAFLAGVALGSLAMRTRSIYSGFFVHVSVALMMDLLALSRGAGLPTHFWPR
jgi:membrane protease YdiL (CAAX protease family)